MIFSSAIFLFSFLPIALGLYYLAPHKLKNLVLLIVSLIFYTWGEDKIVVVMLLSAMVDFSCGLLIERGNRKTGLAISIATNLSFLLFFKYFNFAFDNFNYVIETLGFTNATIQNLPQIALPIGISFYTFQTLSYTIDVYRGTVKANKNFINFATYVTMFPQLVAGPIVRYADINEQLEAKQLSIDDFSIGVERFIVGLAKKVLLANTFAAIADSIFALNTADVSTPFAWLGIIAYAFQIYFDFSGYSDMAIGLGRMFGFRFLENFNYPYISTSIKEFWRRWHISLSSWFRDYLYISLGGSRVGKIKLYRNLFIVFFVTGLWHGASWSFVIWGLFHGLFIVIERIGFDQVLSKLWKPLQHLYTLVVVLVGWVFFRAETLPDAMRYLQQMFVPSLGEAATNSYLSFLYLNSYTFIVSLLAIVFSFPVYHYFDKKTQEPAGAMIRIVMLFALFVLSIIHLGADSYNPFIYFRF
ncbi:MBOAT family O-acyltransferase [Aureispira anguillae]|uniref:MBOAT family protein n=1 Tax=Aureispira anguillae TaxID=2864201 RepID=A0A916DV76_9BACT|nr:MBOAT family O-acyltransferase [Aureispira anguillae]BDS14844.1 MBOAT family protein [Aureispira anguillae]